ncbi:MAG: hypothetical protein ACKVX9_17310 [Blastocatellia bacterium]
MVDTVCFADQATAVPEEATKVAAEHTKECALMEDCVKGGYGVYADGKWYPFDAKGNELAKTAFEKTDKDSSANKLPDTAHPAAIHFGRIKSNSVIYLWMSPK